MNLTKNRVVRGSALMVGMTGVTTLGAQVVATPPASASSGPGFVSECVTGGLGGKLEFCLSVYGQGTRIDRFRVGFRGPGPICDAKAQGYGNTPPQFTEAVLKPGCYGGPFESNVVEFGRPGGYGYYSSWGFCANVAWGGGGWSDSHPCIRFPIP